MTFAGPQKTVFLSTSYLLHLPISFLICFCVALQHFLSNKDLYKNDKMMPFPEMITDRCWRWLGHVVRLGNINNVKVSLMWSPEGRRSGTIDPKTTYNNSIERLRVNGRDFALPRVHRLKMW